MEHYRTVPRSSSTLPPFSPSFDVQSNGDHRAQRHRPSAMTRHTSTTDELSPDVLIRRLREFSVPSGDSSSALPNSHSSLTLPPLSTTSSRHAAAQSDNEANFLNYRTSSGSPSSGMSSSTAGDRVPSKQTMGYLLNGSATFSSDVLTPPISFVHSSSPTSSPASVKHHHHHSSPNYFNAYPCRKCDSVFPTRDSLANHTKTHHRNDRPFQCDWPNCGLRFIKKDHAVKHWRVVHLKERPFKCPSCESRFGQRSDLNKHHRSVHLGIRPFECGYADCGLRFSHRGNLIRHQTVVHDKKKPFACSLCSFTFAEKSNLVKHTQAVHKKSPSSYAPLPSRGQHQHQ